MTSMHRGGFAARGRGKTGTRGAEDHRESGPVLSGPAGVVRTIGRGGVLLGCLLLAAFLLLPSQAGATYEKIRVPFQDGGDLRQVFIHPDLELMAKEDGALVLLSRPELTALLREKGIQVEVLVPDLEAYYAARTRGERDYGIWHTYAETVDEMNLIHSQFPSLTTVPSSIGSTGEGRIIWAMKVSDNPGLQEAEPEVLFDGVHHAREIMTVEDNLHFIRYLCENYASDPAIRFLVDNRQIWFVPILNVDGFVYNELTYPNGGGMWRKNRRNNGGGCWGVDNNRNYTYQWGGSGSSPDPCSETYRGPSPASEPENVAIMNLVNAHQFVVWQSYHSVAGMVLFPWGYTTQHTQDDATFRAIATEMASQNGYQIGQPPEILYTVNGGSFDWGYGATTEHTKIFAFTTEIGGSDFWPQTSERDGLIAENLHANIYLCQIAGPYLELVSLQVTGGNGNGRLDPGETASLVVTIRNPGLLAGANNVRATLSCQDPYIVLSDAYTTLGNLAPGASGSSTLDPFDLEVDPSCPGGRSVNFTVKMEADGGLAIEGSISLTVGQAVVLYGDDFEQPGSDWFSDPTHTATTGAFVRVDPVRTPYQPEDDTTPAPGVNAWITAQNPGGQEGTDDVDNGVAATRSPAINLSGVSHAQLDLNYFHGQRDQGDDPTGDFFRIDLSNNGGASFPVNLLLIGDVTTQANWRNLKADLEDYLPLTSQMMIRVQAADQAPNNDIVEGGVDDVFIFGGSSNQPPTAPVLLAPPDGSQGQPATPTLRVYNATDPEGDALTYGFRVYSDPFLTVLAATVDGVPQGSGSTSWTVNPPLANGTYYWRAYAADPTLRGLYMTPASFTVTGSSDVADGTVPASALGLSVGPNPARGDVRIRYYTPFTPISKLEIFDLSGRKVRSLEGARWAEGWKEAVWDGRVADGSRAPSGVYWVRLALPGETRSVRVVRLN